MEVLVNDAHHHKQAHILVEVAMVHIQETEYSDVMIYCPQERDG